MAKLTYEVALKQRVGTKLLLITLKDDRKVYCHWCPGCGYLHTIDVDQPNHSDAQWSYNNNADKPSFSPSINRSPDYPQHQCHYWIRDGIIEYCTDCYHSLKGTKVELPDIPESALVGAV